MTPDPDAVIDALTLIVGEVRNDAKLQTWFRELAGQSEDQRRQALARVTCRMNTWQASDELLAAFELLAHPPLFAAALLALHEQGVRM